MAAAPKAYPQSDGVLQVLAPIRSESAVTLEWAPVPGFRLDTKGSDQIMVRADSHAPRRDACIGARAQSHPITPDACETIGGES